MTTNRRGRDFVAPLKRPEVLGPEHNIWFWNPNLIGVRFADVDVMAKLRQIGDDLSITWNPITERWQVWAVAPTLQHKICHGWRLLFVHHDADGSYLPLDERVFARIYAIDGKRQGNAKQYFERIVAEMARDKEKRERQWSQDTIDAAMPSFDHGQISVSMRGHSNGSKFSTYHS